MDEFAMYQRLWIFAATLLMVISGCDTKSSQRAPEKVTPADVRHDIDQAANTTVDLSHQEKERFKQELEIRLKDFEVEMSRLRERGRDLTDDAKVKWDRTMSDLEAKQKIAQVKLAEIGNSSEEAWKDFQTGAKSAWEEFSTALHDAAREFDSSTPPR